ncbi:MAG TPA: tetratricopeptide repeat protein [Phycisphaerae bacterium]|nr:tetratricopeptide repeat protein [Phycisphaerae bacterium]
MSTMTTQQALDLALQHHHAGRLPQAEAIYREILARDPKHSDAWHLLGVVAHMVGRNQEAVELIGRAVKLNPTTAIYYNSAGVALMALGRVDDAIMAYQSALRYKQNYPEAHNNLGNALKAQKRLVAAITAFQTAVTIKPDYAEAWNSLGTIYLTQRRHAEAATAFRTAIERGKNYFEAHNNLGLVLLLQGFYQQAADEYRQALQIKPDDAAVHNNLGQALAQQGQLDAAIAEYHEALRLKPDLADSHNNLGYTLRSQWQFDAAIASCRTAVELKPDFADAWNNLGIALRENKRVDESLGAFQQGLRLTPNDAKIHNNLANSLKDLGKIDAAIAAYRTALKLNPNMASIHSNLIYTLHLHGDYDAAAIHEEQVRWNQRHAEPLKSFMTPHPQDRDPDRRLKIGYVSPDLAAHVIGWNLLELFEHLDREKYEIYCYSGVMNPDEITDRLRARCAGWRSIVGVSDRDAAQMIRDDRIDILIDLSLHTAGNRLLIFAHKPAPVQATWLGYPGSTGLSAIDYRLSDPHLDPPETDLSVYSEKTLRLPETFWCYHAGPTPDPSPPPVLEAGFITFGSLNNFHKISPAVLNLWARILKRVEHSRLIVHCKPGSHLEELHGEFIPMGILRDRVEFVGQQSWEKYIGTYARIDVALDPFPYCGGITTCDALWMGVPVVTLSGRTAVGRAGRSILSNVGLPELVAKNMEEYIDIAVNLAGDLPRLQEFHTSLRQRMRTSPLMDAPRFARNMEAAYREMWHSVVK